jgi:hypothetical protein
MVVKAGHARGLLLTLLLALPRLLFAQEDTPAAPANWTLMLHVDQQKGSGFSDNELFMISRSLLIALQGTVRGTTIVESPESLPPASPGHLTSLATAAGANAWVWVEITADKDSTRLAVRSFDVLHAQSVIDQAVRREGRLSVFDLPFETWEDIAGLTRDRFRGAEVAGKFEGLPSAVITLKALPGTRIRVSQGPAVTADRDGNAEIALAFPAEYSLKATLAGYHDETQRLFLTANRKIEFAQKADSLWAVEGSLKDFGYPGFDVTRFIVPSFFWVRLGITTYLAGIALAGQSSSGTGDQGSVFSSNPLTNVLFQTGIYFTPKDQLFRLYGEAGIFFRVFHPLGAWPRLEPISWGGFQLTIGTEIAQGMSGAFFAEYTPMMYFTGIPNLFRASLGTYDPPPGWVFTPKAAISLLSFRVGYRWQL